MKPRIICGDSLIAMRRMPDNSIDAVVTDPPYGIGFMNKHWDYEVPSVELWQEVLRVLKPGGYALSFGSPKTQHRIAVNIEDAGFEIRDVLAWVYGSGFPKSLNIAKQSPDLVHFDGWGTALKPAYEPIVMARKPLIGTVAENVLAHGVGGINIDACRVPHDEALRTGAGATWEAMHANEGRRRNGEASADRRYDDKGGTNFAMMPGPRGGDARGRWPANLCHDGSEEVVSLFPANAPGCKTPSAAKCESKFRPGQGEYQKQGPIYADTGSAARFFYCAKTSKPDRDEGLSYLDLKSADAMVERVDGTVGMNSPRAGAGRTSGARNHHPTVKPTELMRWLVRMVTPPGGLVLDPFMGSGSTGKACALDGFGFVGIDREIEYCQIAIGRITHALNQSSRR